MNRKGLSLIEVLIAIGLFAIVTVVSSTILIDIVQLEKRSTVQNAIYEDLRLMLQSLTKEIQSGTIDYDEYYNYCVIQSADQENAYFGVNHGVYGSRFFDPGKRLDGADSHNPTDLGIECSYVSGTECEVIYSLSTDLNTGQNPFFGDPYDPEDASAFHDRGIEICAGHGDTFAEVDHLFLIDNTGTKKTMISRKKNNVNDWTIGLLRMQGHDVDQNGLVDTFTCMDEFTCEADPTKVGNAISIPYSEVAGITKLNLINNLPIRLPNQNDLDDAFDYDSTHFVPISPLRANVIDLQFIIKPLEDPYKGFAEPDFRTHPTVTIILTVGLAESAAEDYPGDFEPITVQTTIAAGVTGRIETYPPVNEILMNPGTSTGWMDTLVPATPFP